MLNSMFGGVGDPRMIELSAQNRRVPDMVPAMVPELYGGCEVGSCRMQLWHLARFSCLKIKLTASDYRARNR